ncbi:MAG: hypothetical protein LUD02_11035 [Tannerellaceae bacterium]|nr:hypothetical protein [Tannerellaceae bacterium]
MNKIKVIYLLMFVCVWSATTGCTDYKENEPEIPATEQGDQVEVTLALDIPSVTIGTKAMTEQQERLLQQVDFLVFEVNGGTEKFSYRTHSTNDLSNETGSNMYVRGTFRRSQEGEEYRLVLIANLRNELDQLFGDDPGQYEGLSKNELLEKITFTQEKKMAGSL